MAGGREQRKEILNVDLQVNSLSVAAIDTGIVASVTQTQEGATPLEGQINFVSTVANASDSVRLPAAAPFTQVQIRNNGAANLQIFPAEDDAIDGGVTDAADTNVLAAGGFRIYVATEVGEWVTLFSG